MRKQKNGDATCGCTAQNQFIRAIAACLLLCLLAVAGCKGGHPELVGSWRLAEIDGKLVDAHSASSKDIPTFELLDTGTFTMTTFSTVGTWSVDSTKLVLHAEKYNGQTREQFKAEMTSKYPGDASMQKMADQAFADFTLTIDKGGKSLSTKAGEMTQTYHRFATRTPQ